MVYLKVKIEIFYIECGTNDISFLLKHNIGRNNSNNLPSSPHWLGLKAQEGLEMVDSHFPSKSFPKKEGKQIGQTRNDMQPFYKKSYEINYSNYLRFVSSKNPSLSSSGHYYNQNIPQKEPKNSAESKKLDILFLLLKKLKSSTIITRKKYPTKRKDPI